MSEFDANVQVARPADQSATVTAPVRAGLLQRPLLLGLSLPWLLGCVLILALAGWYLFWEPQPATVHALAFDDDSVALGAGTDSASAATAGMLAVDTRQLQDEVAGMVGGVRTFAETNRVAIGKLSETVRAQNAAIDGLRKQLADSQANYSALLTRVSVLEARPLSVVPRVYDGPAKGKKTPSVLGGMRLDAVQNGMAWVHWQGKTWAVQAGDTLGRVTITGIDAENRQVRTSAGTLR